MLVCPCVEALSCCAQSKYTAKTSNPGARGVPMTTAAAAVAAATVTMTTTTTNATGLGDDAEVKMSEKKMTEVAPCKIVLFQDFCPFFLLCLFKRFLLNAKTAFHSVNSQKLSMTESVFLIEV